MDLKTFENAFANIKKQNFVKTKRKGPTGVGYTFETLLGLKENNLALPDIENVEIKAHRDGSSSMITLFTFNKKAWKMDTMEAIRKYGSHDKNGRLGMYYTVSPTPNSVGLFLSLTDDETTICVQHCNGQIIVQWPVEEVAKKFEQKIPSLLFVSARCELRDGIEHFHFYRAQLMSDTSGDLLVDLFKSGILTVDLRLYEKGTTSAGNHGTVVGIKEEKLPLLFKNIKDL